MNEPDLTMQGLLEELASKAPDPSAQEHLRFLAEYMERGIGDPISLGTFVTMLYLRMDVAFKNMDVEWRVTVRPSEQHSSIPLVISQVQYYARGERKRATYHQPFNVWADVLPSLTDAIVRALKRKVKEDRR